MASVTCWKSDALIVWAWTVGAAMATPVTELATSAGAVTAALRRVTAPTGRPRAARSGDKALIGLGSFQTITPRRARARADAEAGVDVRRTRS